MAGRTETDREEKNRQNNDDMTVSITFLVHKCSFLHPFQTLQFSFVAFDVKRRETERADELNFLLYVRFKYHYVRWYIVMVEQRKCIIISVLCSQTRAGHCLDSWLYGLRLWHIDFKIIKLFILVLFWYGCTH